LKNRAAQSHLSILTPSRTPVIFLFSTANYTKIFVDFTNWFVS